MEWSEGIKERDDLINKLATAMQIIKDAIPALDKHDDRSYDIKTRYEILLSYYNKELEQKHGDKK